MDDIEERAKRKAQKRAVKELMTWLIIETVYARQGHVVLPVDKAKIITDGIGAYYIEDND